MIAQLDGPVYVERVALFDNKQRVKAQKAIRKALQLQVENRGFALRRGALGVPAPPGADAPSRRSAG